jgi:hypothetical protein
MILPINRFGLRKLKNTIYYGFMKLKLLTIVKQKSDHLVAF